MKKIVNKKKYQIAVIFLYLVLCGTSWESRAAELPNKFDARKINFNKFFITANQVVINNKVVSFKGNVEYESKDHLLYINAEKVDVFSKDNSNNNSILSNDVEYLHFLNLKELTFGVYNIRGDEAKFYIKNHEIVINNAIVFITDQQIKISTKEFRYNFKKKFSTIGDQREVYKLMKIAF